MQVLITGGEWLEKWAKEQQGKLDKAAGQALNKTAYEISGDIEKALKFGQLGLTVLTPLRKGPAKIQRKRQPLAKLFKGIVYRVDKGNLVAKIGFLGDTAGTMWQHKYAKKSIPGYQWIYTAREREILHLKGIHLKKWTTSAKVPGRDIIGNAYDLFKDEAVVLWKQYFDIKAAGGRW